MANLRANDLAFMYNTFISVIALIHQRDDRDRLPDYLKNLCDLLSSHFAHYEIIVVNNIPELSLDERINPLEAACKQNVYLLNLSTRVNRNHAYLAGLDRSNGDYTVIFDLDFAHQPARIIDLYQKTQEQYDVVYLRAPSRRTPLFFRLFYKLFYFILRNYSQLQVDDLAHNSRIISRRALNSLLRLRENLRYMKAIYSIVGYRTSWLSTEHPLEESESFGERFRTSLVAITSYTTFLRTLLLWIFLFSVAFLIFVVVNALKVKFSGIDLFGNVGEAWSGWTFLVILIAIFFAVTCLNLYIMSIYLSNIYSEIKQRPLYIIESIKRF